MGPQTLENLRIAMRAEAFAYARYLLCAERAGKNGRHELAELFEKVAKAEHLQHFRELAELASIASNDADSLLDAIGSETYEVKTMYPRFASQARAVGDRAAAERFEEILRDEQGHIEAFTAALRQLEPAGAR